MTETAKNGAAEIDESEILLECRDLVKTFHRGVFRRRKIEALRGVNLKVRRGDVYGFLGENGAGKTTTVRCLIGLTPISGGRIVVFGQENPRPETLFQKVSYSPEETNIFTGLTGRELLVIYGRLYGVEKNKLTRRIDEVLETVNLVEAADRYISGYSKGMRQRIGLAQAILSEPELIILDEPARGLDPVGRRRFRDVINEYASKGTTFFINSHTLSEVEKTCNRIGIIKKGRVIRELAPRDLEKTNDYEICYQAPAPLPESAPRDRLHVIRALDTLELSEICARIDEIGGRVESVARGRVSLEDYFIKVVGDEEVVL